MSEKGQIEINANILKSQKSINNIADFKKLFQASLKKETSQILQTLLLASLVLATSDTHIEREKTQAKLRLRIDGILHDALYMELDVYQKLLSRIKLISGIKLNITKKAQDGRFTIIIESTPIEVRVSTLPAEYGETIEMRILNPKSLVTIEQLGMRQDIAQELKRHIQKPNGMIISTGPTGCGKTTTLYAILQAINKPEIKIITIEDPIEYHLTGVSQTQVSPKKGYTFATGLRAIVRQDPDVILVGEIRDKKTARIALQAALTGHLVLSTLHTNDAAGTIVRLQALGEKAINIAPAINLSIAQRLIRKLCEKCAESYIASSQEIAIFKKQLSSLSKQIRIPAINNKLKLFKTKGCKACNNTGYKGRTGIYEFLIIDNEIQSFILKSPSIAELTNKAIKKGMTTMYRDGLIKALQGITTIEEINRVAESE